MKSTAPAYVRTYAILLNTQQSSCSEPGLFNEWLMFLGFLCENFLFSVVPCLKFSPWLTHSSPRRTLLLICKAWKEMPSWMATSITRDASGNNYNRIAVYKKDMDCGNRPAGNARKQEIQKPQQMGPILRSEILPSLKYFCIVVLAKKQRMTRLGW